MDERGAADEGLTPLGRAARGGNRSFAWVPREGVRYFVKVYGERRGRLRSLGRRIAHRCEGRLGASAAERHDLERRHLELWRAHGFDVPALHAETPPASVGRPALVMEWVEGRALQHLLHEGALDPDAEAAHVARYAESTRRRIEAARANDERGLLHEHPGFLHVIVAKERLITFDLEGGWRPSHPLERAVENEIAGLARSLLRAAPDRAEALLSAFVRGYGDDEGLAALVRAGLARRNLRFLFHRLRWWWRAKRRGKLSKRDGLAALAQHLPAHSRPRSANDT